MRVSVCSGIVAVVLPQLDDWVTPSLQLSHNKGTYKGEGTHRGTCPIVIVAVSLWLPFSSQSVKRQGQPPHPSSSVMYFLIKVARVLVASSAIGPAKLDIGGNECPESGQWVTSQLPTRITITQIRLQIPIPMGNE